MSEVVRLYRYKSLLSGRRAVSVEVLMASFEISRATFKRDMAKLTATKRFFGGGGQVWLTVLEKNSKKCMDLNAWGA